VSAGSHPVRHGSRGIDRTQWGAGKPRHVGLTLLTRRIVSELEALLAESGCAGLLIAFVVLHLDAGQVVALRRDDDDHCVFRLERGDDDEPDEIQQFELPADLAEALADGLAWLAAQGFDGLQLGRFLYGRGRALQRRIREPWAMHVTVDVNLLHQLGNGLALSCYGQRFDYLRAYAGSRYADPTELRPPASEDGVAHFGVAARDFYGAIGELLVEEKDRP
jgi:hypothetical protein